MTELLLEADKLTLNNPIDSACQRVPPLWPLQTVVAVNPFMGLHEMPFQQANKLMEKVAHSPILMNSDYYLEQINKAAFGAEEIRGALAQQGICIGKNDPVEWLKQSLNEFGREQRILTVTDWLDQTRATNWSSFVVDEISKWCASYFDRGQSSWAMPWADLPLYQAWLQAASIDANAEVFGLKGFRQHVKSLPGSDVMAIEQALNLLQIPSALASDFLHRELMSISGWAAYCACLDRQPNTDQFVRQLLAIRLAYDTALVSLANDWKCQIIDVATQGGCTQARYIAQMAAESAFRTKLVSKLYTSPAMVDATPRMALQAIFCIDVRSEVYRRALEAQSSAIETIGFAGFFGMPVQVDDAALCPVLIAPQHRLQTVTQETGYNRFGRRIALAWNNLCTSATACFPAVEISGLLFGLRLLRRSGHAVATPASTPKLTWLIPLSQRVDMAADALKNMSLDPSRLAKVVLICGHGGSTENNPYASSLDCGACGGHKGDVNARFAAALYNDPAVRQSLRQREILIPEDTIFLAGLHTTTTDDVTLFESGLIPAQQLSEIEAWLQVASNKARLERSSNLLPDGHAKKVDQQIRHRSLDWSEVRPEWGLAGNAAFIAAPRSRTRSLNLEGRVFLHEYDPMSDRDGSVLQLILTAPVVVASWISLQYYASTVNNQLFGSGNKVLHNVAGRFGIWEGNGGDLRTGLPLQSLHNGTKWMHQPLRLQVFLDSPRQRIEMVLNANQGIRSLFENQWIHLTAIEGDSFYAYRGPSRWHAIGTPAA